MCRTGMIAIDLNIACRTSLFFNMILDNTITHTNTRVKLKPNSQNCLRSSNSLGNMLICFLVKS